MFASLLLVALAPVPGALDRLGSPALRHADPVTAVASSSNGNRLASGSSARDGGTNPAVKVWDAASGALAFGAPHASLGVAWFPDGVVAPWPVRKQLRAPRRQAGGYGEPEGRPAGAGARQALAPRRARGPRRRRWGGFTRHTRRPGWASPHKLRTPLRRVPGRRASAEVSRGGLAARRTAPAPRGGGSQTGSCAGAT